MNSTDYSRPDRAELQQAVVDSLLTALRDARETGARIVDLEAERDTYRSLAAAALECAAALTRRNKQLARRNDELTEQVRALMAAPCLTCRRGTFESSERVA